MLSRDIPQVKMAAASARFIPWFFSDLIIAITSSWNFPIFSFFQLQKDRFFEILRHQSFKGSCVRVQKPPFGTKTRQGCLCPQNEVTTCVKHRGMFILQHGRENRNRNNISRANLSQSVGIVLDNSFLLTSSVSWPRLGG